MNNNSDFSVFLRRDREIEPLPMSSGVGIRSNIKVILTIHPPYNV